MKKLLSLFLSAFLFLSLAVPAFATKSNSEQITSRYSVAIVQDTCSSCPQLLSTDGMSLTASELNALSKTELQNYDMVTVNSSHIATLSKETVINLLQSGGVFCIETSDTDNALSAIFSLIEEEKTVTIETSGVEHVGVYITMRNGTIIPGIITIGSVSFSDTGSIPATADTSTSETLHLTEKIDINNFLDHVFSAKNATPPTSVSTTSARMAPSGFVKEFDNYTSFNAAVIAQNVIGSVYITQYIYDICRYTSGGKTIEISDVVSHITVDAGTLSYVKTYDTKIRSNSTSMSIIDQTYLASNSNTSVSLSGGFSANAEDILSGDLSTSTTYTYDTNNQTITNNFASNTYNCWAVNPTENWGDASWVLDPGVRVKNSNASVYSSSAYTSVEEIAFKWHYMSAQSGTEVYTSPLSVGGYW